MKCEFFLVRHNPPGHHRRRGRGYGLVAGLILASGDTFQAVYGLPAENALVPFSQLGIVTIPLGFVTLVVVSWMTRRGEGFSRVYWS